MENIFVCFIWFPWSFNKSLMDETPRGSFILPRRICMESFPVNTNPSADSCGGFAANCLFRLDFGWKEECGAQSSHFENDWKRFATVGERGVVRPKSSMLPVYSR